MAGITNAVSYPNAVPASDVISKDILDDPSIIRRRGAAAVFHHRRSAPGGGAGAHPDVGRFKAGQ